jgi:hypothetical protein
MYYLSLVVQCLPVIQVQMTNSSTIIVVRVNCEEDLRLINQVLSGLYIVP